MRPRPSVLHLDYHLERLAESASELGIPLARVEELREAFRENLLLTCEQHPGQQSLRLRLSVSNRGIEACVTSFELREESLVRLFPVPFERAYPAHKHFSITGLRDATELAKQSGADEALLVGHRTEVLEGAWSNFFWFDETGALCTAGRGVLPGVTRRILVEQQPVLFKQPALEDVLRNCTGALITRATDGLLAVKQIGERTIQTNSSELNNLLGWFHHYRETHLEPI